MFGRVAATTLVPMSRGAVVVTVAGEMSPALRREFDDFEVSVDRSTTHIRLPDADPSMLRGVLDRIESLGLELLHVQQEP
jgi:hypothetical protein